MVLVDHYSCLHLSSVRICSYRGGSMQVFHDPIRPDGSEMILEEFIEFAGPLWTGHTLCEEEDLAKNETITIVQRVGISSNFTLTLDNSNITQETSSLRVQYETLIAVL